jgi:hypothetical protein
MFTDSLPKMERLRAEYRRSDHLRNLDLPADERLRMRAGFLEEALKTGEPAPVRKACVDFLAAAAEFYSVSNPESRVLAARPLRVREDGWATELFGDYHLEKKLIRIWMRTAVQKRVTSFGTFFSTLCHEFCHHLDNEHFGFPSTPHTRGFYERTAALYHHARGMPAKSLFWAPLPNGRWRIDWPRTNRGR